MAEARTRDYDRWLTRVADLASKNNRRFTGPWSFEGPGQNWSLALNNHSILAVRKDYGFPPAPKVARELGLTKWLEKTFFSGDLSKTTVPFGAWSPAFFTRLSRPVTRFKSLRESYASEDPPLAWLRFRFQLTGGAPPFEERPFNLKVLSSFFAGVPDQHELVGIRLLETTDLHGSPGYNAITASGGGWLGVVLGRKEGTHNPGDRIIEAKPG